MYVHANTLKALDVFADESTSQASGRTKEGLSLYGLITHYIKTPAAMAKVKEWLQNPLVDYEEINLRLDMVEWLRNHHEFFSLREKMHLIKSVKRLIKHAEEGIKIKLGEWRSIVSVSTFLCLVMI